MTIRDSINHLYVNKYRYFPLQIHSWKTLSFLEKSNIKPYPKRVIHNFSQCPRTIRGSNNHLYVNKYRHFPIQIHSCKTLSFLEKSNIKPYPKRVIHVFSQCPRAIRGSSNHAFAFTELILDYIPEPLENRMLLLQRFLLLYKCLYLFIFLFSCSDDKIYIYFVDIFFW